MPQVNEFSWYSMSFNILFLYFVVLFSFSFIVLDTNINDLNCNLNYFSYMI